MDHFAIIQALCRAAMASPSPAVRKQVERLRDALKQQGEGKQAATLSAILTSSKRTQDMAPSRITLSRDVFAGEDLSPKTPVPVDRETSSPLAEIVFPEQLADQPPLFDRRLTEAVDALLEEWANIPALMAVGAPPPKSCLIFGAPGTGKTRLALWIAHRLDLPVVLARLDSLVSSFLGTSSRNIANLFAFANRYRCLFLLDEFDAIAKLRDDPHEVGEIKRVVNALMQHLDLRQPVGLTIGITNHQQLLDPAVWRRFEVQLEIPKPQFQVRLEIAKQYMAPIHASEPHLKTLAWFTEGASGAEIEALVRAYKKGLAINPDEERHFIRLLKRFATLNTGRISDIRKQQINADEEQLLRVLRDDPDLKLTLEEIGVLVHKNKSTVSRQMTKKPDDRKGGA
jgi:SpoVK/Ycf46/Vps4 family AAA+-type ATPase